MPAVPFILMTDNPGLCALPIPGPPPLQDLMSTIKADRPRVCRLIRDAPGSSFRTTQSDPVASERARRRRAMRSAPYAIDRAGSSGVRTSNDTLWSHSEDRRHGAVIRVRPSAQPFPERAFHRHRLRAAARHNVIDEGWEAGVAAERHILGKQQQRR